MKLNIVILAMFFAISCKEKAQNAEYSKEKKKSINKTVQDTISKTKYTSKDTISYDKKYLLGKFDYSNDSNFVRIESNFTDKPNQYLRKEALDAFKKMYFAAQKEKIYLKIISATRSFSDQKRIWENKWNSKYVSIKNETERAKTILKFSSMPCTSRHHWGTDMDFNSLENKYFETTEGVKIYNWLKNNASKYGFYQPYTAKSTKRPSGYEEEKWHWSYIPIAKKMLKYYLENITYTDITNFEGSKYAKTIDIINLYVNGVNQECK